MTVGRCHPQLRSWSNIGIRSDLWALEWISLPNYSWSFKLSSTCHYRLLGCSPTKCTLSHYLQIYKSYCHLPAQNALLATKWHPEISYPMCTSMWSLEVKVVLGIVLFEVHAARIILCLTLNFCITPFTTLHLVPSFLRSSSPSDYKNYEFRDPTESTTSSETFVVMFRNLRIHDLEHR